MTGVGGRPEVIVEGSNSTDGGWLEYEFLYKPGDVYRRPPVVGKCHLYHCRCGISVVKWQMCWAVCSYVSLL